MKRGKEEKRGSEEDKTGVRMEEGNKGVEKEMGQRKTRKMKWRRKTNRRQERRLPPIFFLHNKQHFFIV